MLLGRAVPLVALIALLTAPVAAWAKPLGLGDNYGTLSILRGKGTVEVQATGALIGQVRKGKVKVKIFKNKHGGDHGQVIIRMRGQGTVRHKQNGTVVYDGRRIRIRIVDEKFRVQINGGGIHLSAVAQGNCTLQAAPDAADPGVFQLNIGPYQALPPDQTTYPLNASSHV